MPRSVLFRRAAVLVLGVGLAACRQDMHDAPRYEPLEASTFFANGQSARMPIANTVARGMLHDDDELLYTGKVNGTPANLFPMAVTSAVMATSSAPVSFLRANAVGHIAPSSRRAASWKPNVAYRVLNFCAA